MPPTNPTLASHQAAYGINLYLILNDDADQKYPVVSASIEFALNQIPVANVVLPAGKKISRDAEADVKNLTINRRVKAKLLLTGRGVPHPSKLKSSPSPTADVDDLVVFDGYIGAIHYQFNSNAVSSTIVLFHWLHDLDISTVASGNFMKVSPADWFSPEGDSRSVKNSEPFLYRLKAPSGSNSKEFLTRDDILNLDWWEGIFKPGLYYKATQRLTRFAKANTADREPNKYLINVLDKIKSENRLRLNNKAKSGLKLKIPTQTNLGQLFSDVIMGSAGGSSAFEKLIGLSREFKFVLAPRIDDCILKEYNPVGAINKTLTADDFDFAGSSTSPTVLPAAVILYGNPTELSSVTKRDSSANPLVSIDNTFVGQFPNPISSVGIATGPFLVVPTPAWMHTIVSSDVLDFNTGIVILPDSSKAPNNPGTPTQPSAKEQFRVFADAYAQSVYYDNLFASKTQDIVCGFRTDIELGDSVLLTFGEMDKVLEKRGVVNSINHIFSAGDSPRVNTVIRLKHVFDGSDMDYFKVRTGVPHAFFVGK